MVVVLVFLLAAVLGAVAIVATGRGAELSEEPPDRPPPPQLPQDRLVDAVDVNRLRIPLAFRGYRMEDVDRVLDRLAGELAERDRQIEALGQELFEGAAALDGGSAPFEGRADGTARDVDDPAAPESGEPTGASGPAGAADQPDRLTDQHGQVDQVGQADWLTSQYPAAERTDTDQHDEAR